MTYICDPKTIPSTHNFPIPYDVVIQNQALLQTSNREYISCQESADVI